MLKRFIVLLVMLSSVFATANVWHGEITMTANWPIPPIVAVSIGGGGNAFGIIVPFIGLSEPQPLICPLMHAILILLSQVIAMIVGVPASLLTMRHRPVLGAVTLIGCVCMWMFSLAAIRVTDYILGVPVSF